MPQESERYELYRVDVAVPGTATKINEPPVADGEVWFYSLAF